MSKSQSGMDSFLDRMSNPSNSINWYGLNLLTLFSSSSQMDSWEISQSLKSLEKLANRIENLHQLNWVNEDHRIGIEYIIKLTQFRIKICETQGLELNLKSLTGSWANSQLDEIGNYSINVSYEGLRLITILNAICLDIINQANTQENTKFLNDKFSKIAEAILYSFISFFDYEGVIGSCNQTINLEKKGLLSILGLRDDDYISKIPLLMNFDHQLEFIVLHELGHFFHSHFETSARSSSNISDEYKELDADSFAILTARKIWSSTNKFHTVYCEFFQLVLFLYFDLYDFLSNAISRASRLSVPVYLRDKIPESEAIDSHPISTSRFLNVIASLPRISSTSQFFLSAVEHVFEKFKDDMIRGKVDLSPIIQLSRVKAQRIMNRWGHFEHDIPMNKLDVHSFDSADYHLDGKILNPNIWLRSNNFETKDWNKVLYDLMSRERNSFSKHIASLFGSLDSNKLVKEIENQFRI